MSARIPILTASAVLLIVLADGPRAAAGDEVCGLLKASEVTAVFPSAKAGQPDASRRKYGITACLWRTDHGTFMAQTWKSEGGSARDEASGLMLGVLDPLKPGGQKNVRYETIKGDAGLKDVPIMAVTAYAAKGDEERIREAGAEAYVSKPVTVSRFMEAVRGLTD